MGSCLGRPSDAPGLSLEEALSSDGITPCRCLWQRCESSDCHGNI